MKNNYIIILNWEDLQSQNSSLYDVINRNTDSMILFKSTSTQISDYCIDRMKCVLEKSEHHMFAFPSSQVMKCEYEEAIIDVDTVLIDANHMNGGLIKKGINELTPKVLCELALELKKYGFLSLRVDCTEENSRLYAKGADISFYRPQNKEKKLLFLINGAPRVHNGTYVHLIGILDGLLASNAKGYRLVLGTVGDMRTYSEICSRYSELETVPIEQLSEFYDLCFIYGHNITSELLCVLDEYCTKWIWWPLDLIAYRSGISTREQVKGQEELARFADGIITTTEAVKFDMDCCFVQENNLKSCRRKVCYIPVEQYREDLPKAEMSQKCPFDDFVLVFGNSTFLHKMIKPCVESLLSWEGNIIVVGWTKQEFITDNIYAYPSGGLEQDYIDYLFQTCQCFVFPSMDEGFGIPVLHALNCGKNVVVQNNSINRELQKLNSVFMDHYFFFNDFADIQDVIKSAIANRTEFSYNLYARTWEDVGRDVWDLIFDISNDPIDYKKAAKRRFEYRGTDSVQRNMLTKMLTNMIIRTDMSRLINEGKVIDIYGCGNNGKILANNIRQYVGIGCFIDRNPKNKNWNGIEVIDKKNYKYANEHLIIVMPVYDFENIKNELVDCCGAEEDRIISAVDFLAGIK